MLPIFGVDINAYNRLPGSSFDQIRLNHIITAVNRMITCYNDQSDLSTPTVVTLIHHNKGRNRWSHRYKYLYDGCHMGHEALKYYAKQLVKSLKSNQTLGP